MRKTILSSVVVALAAFCSYGATYYYYLNPTNDYTAKPYLQPLVEGSYWTTARDGSGEVGAAGALKSSSTYHYVIGCGSELGPSNTTYVTNTLSCSGYILDIGDKYVTPWTPGAIVQDCPKTKLTFTESKSAYLNKGLFLYKGISTTTTLKSGVVNSPASEPFHIAFATNSLTATWSGTTKGAADVGLLIGGSSELCPDASKQTGNTFYMSGATTAYYGTITVTNENRTIPSFSTRPLTFKIKTGGGIPGTVRMCDYTAYALAVSNSVNTLKNLELGNNVLLSYPVGSLHNSKIVVTNSFAVAEGAKVQVYLGVTSAFSEGERKLTLLTVPETSELNLDDFELVGYEGGAYSYLTVEADTAKHTKSLVCMYTHHAAETVYAKGSDDKSHNNNKASYYTSIITNGTKWSDGEPVSAGKDYILRAYATTVYAMRTPQASWTDGAGNTGADFTFPGKSLSVGNGCWLMPIGNKVTFADVSADNGSIFAIPSVSGVTVHEFAGNLNLLAGETHFRPYNTHNVHLSANLSGSGCLSFEGWSSSAGNTIKNTIWLEGDNSAFAGTMKISSWSTSASMSYSYGETVSADSGARFGAALAAYDPEALVLEKFGTLELTGPVTLAANRGVSVYGNGRFRTENGASFAADGLSLDGALTLDGVASFGTFVGTAGSSILLGGALTVGEGDAFRGLTLTTSGASALKFVSDGLSERGLDLSATTLTIGSTLSVSCVLSGVVATGEVLTNGVVTVTADKVDTLRACIDPKTWSETGVAGYVVSEIVNIANEDGTVTISEVLVSSGYVAHIGVQAFNTVDAAIAAGQNTDLIIVLDQDAAPVLADGSYNFNANGYNLDMSANVSCSRYTTEGGIAKWVVNRTAGEFVVQVGSEALPGNYNKFWNFQDAVNYAVAQATGSAYLKALRDAATPGFNVPEGKFNVDTGLEIDLDGKTITFNFPYESTNYYAMRFLKKNKVYVHDGTLAATNVTEGAQYELVNIIRNFTDDVTIENVMLDGRGLAYTNDEVRTTYYTLNGTTRFIGSTSLIAYPGERAFVSADHAGRYSLKTNTFETTGIVKGNFLICGGKLFLNQGQFDPGNRYYFGAGKNDTFTDDDTDTFEARIGDLIPPTGVSSNAVGGEFFYTFDQAFRAIDDDDYAGRRTIATLKDVTLAAADVAEAEKKRYVYEGTNNIAIDTNGHVFDTAADIAFVNAGTGKMTFRGDGTVVTTNSPAAVNTCLWAKNGNIDISEGTFVNNSATGEILREGDGAGAQGNFTITGGRFRNLATADCDIDSHLANGYVSWLAADGFRTVGGRIVFVTPSGLVVRVDGVETNEVRGLVGSEIEFTLASDLKMPVYYRDGEKVTSCCTNAIPGGTTNLTLTVVDAADPTAEISNDDRAAGIVESVEPGPSHDAAVAKLETLFGPENENAKRVGVWLDAWNISSAALAASTYSQASFALGTKLLDGETITVTVTEFKPGETAGTFDLTFAFADGEDPLAVAADAAEYAKTLVDCAEDLGFKTKVDPTVSAEIDEGRVNVSVTMPEGKAKAFMKVAVPVDK